MCHQRSSERQCFWIIEPKGSMYNKKRVGAKMDPCGTPQVIGAEEEEKVPMLTERESFVSEVEFKPL